MTSSISSANMRVKGLNVGVFVDIDEIRRIAIERFESIGLARLDVGRCEHEFGVMSWVRSKTHSHATQFYCKRCLVRVSSDELHFIGR